MKKKEISYSFFSANEKFASHLFFFDEGYEGGSLYLNWLPSPSIDVGLRVELVGWSRQFLSDLDMYNILYMLQTVRQPGKNLGNAHMETTHFKRGFPELDRGMHWFRND